jgi:hypothetical protein
LTPLTSLMMRIAARPEISYRRHKIPGHPSARDG